MMRGRGTRRHPPRAWGEGGYRLLLHFFPREFRRRYSADLLDFYRERMRGAGRSRPARIAAWLHLLPDLFASAFAERFAWLHRDLERAPRVASDYSNRRENPMSILRQDVRYAVRGMCRRPGFTAIILATLALGIGANAAIFTVVNAVLLRPLPFAHPDRIVDLSHDDKGGGQTVSEPEFVDYQRGLPSLARVAAIAQGNVTITAADGDPMRGVATRVSRDFFDLLGVHPEVGRTFAPEEFAPASHAALAVISHRLWMQQFGGERSAVGKTLVVSGVRMTIIGVMPSRFAFPDRETEMWTAWKMNPDSLWTRNNHYLTLVGEIAPGKTLGQLRAEMRTLNGRWPKDFPETYAANAVIDRTATPIETQLFGPTRPYLLALLGAVGFILLIACVNVANLLLVRGEARRKEMAIRTALGASRARVARQLLTESLMLAVAGGALGIIVGWLGTRTLVALAPGDLPRADQIGVDGRVVAFTIAITVITGLAFGLLPAARVVGGDSADMLREGGKTSSHGASSVARRALVVTEIALAVIMLSGAGLLVRSLMKLRAIDLGFDPSRRMTLQVTLPSKKYNDTTAVAFFDDAIEKTRRLPGVASAAAVSYLPIDGSDNGWSIMLDGVVLKTIADAPYARPEHVTPSYFETMGIRVRRGRAFTDQDRDGAPYVAVISEGMARKMWPGVDPIGHTLKMFGDKAPWVTIVGVAADVRARGYQGDVPPTMYFPYAQSAKSAYIAPLSMTIVARVDGDPNAFALPMRRVVRDLDKVAAVSNVASMDDIVGDSIASRRFTTALLGAFAALALVLAGIGIYGVISYGVSQRRYEIGVRMAMGASPGSIVRLVAGEGGRMTAVGLIVGLAGAAAVQRLLASLLVGVTPTDAPTFVIVILLLGAVAALACAVPARRATAVSPTEALRNN